MFSLIRRNLQFESYPNPQAESMRYLCWRVREIMHYIRYHCGIFDNVADKSMFTTLQSKSQWFHQNDKYTHPHIHICIHSIRTWNIYNLIDIQFPEFTFTTPIVKGILYGNNFTSFWNWSLYLWLKNMFCTSKFKYTSRFVIPATDCVQ